MKHIPRGLKLLAILLLPAVLLFLGASFQTLRPAIAWPKVLDTPQITGPRSPFASVRKVSQGLTATLESLEVARQAVQATLCLDLPDKDDWAPDASLILPGGESISLQSWALLDGKNPTIYAGNHRCYHLTFPLEGNENRPLYPLTLRVEGLATSLPETVTLGQCRQAARKVEEQKSVQVKCLSGPEAPGAGFPRIVYSPHHVSQQEVSQAMMDALTRHVDASWTFVVAGP